MDKAFDPSSVQMSVSSVVIIGLLLRIQHIVKLFLVMPLNVVKEVQGFGEKNLSIVG